MDASTPPPSDAATRSWRVHPAADHPARTAVVAVIIAAASLASGQWMGNGAVGWFAAGALVLSLRSYFLPSSYELDDEGAHESKALGGRRSLAWSDVRRVSVDPRGVVVSPRRTISRWLPDHGLFLRTRGKAQRADVLAAVHARVDLPAHDDVAHGVIA